LEAPVVFETAPLPPGGSAREPSDNSEGRNYGLRKLFAGPPSGLSASENGDPAGDSARVHNSGNDVRLRCAGSGGPGAEARDLGARRAVLVGRCRVCGEFFPLDLDLATGAWTVPEHAAPSSGVRS
jgi:hypothetical protein